MNDIFQLKLHVILTFTIALLLIGLSLLILLKKQKSKINVSFLMVCISAAVWLLCYSVAYSSTNMVKASFWFKMGYPGVLFIAITYFHFTGNFLNLVKLKPFILCNYVIGLILIYIIFSGDYLIAGVHQYTWGFYPKAGRFHPYFLAYFLVLVNVASTILGYYYFFKKELVEPIRRQQIKYILTAFSVFTIASIDFIPNYGISIFPCGFIPVTVFLFIITYSILRYRLLDISIVITRTSIFVTVYSFVLGMPFAMAFGLKDKLVHLGGENWWIIPLITSTMLATAGPFIYLYIQKKAEEQLLKEQRRYQSTLRQASAGMSRVKDLNKLVNLISHIVTRTVHIEHTSVYLFDNLSAKFILKSSRHKLKTTMAYEIDLNNIVIQYLKDLKDPLVFEEIKQKNQDYEDRGLKKVEAQMSELDAAVIVPSFIEGKLVALIVLGRKLSGKLYSEDDLAVFSILANQAALAIENAQFYDDVKRTQEQLFQAEKMATIGTMADGLSHQINNRLHALGFIASDALDTIQIKSNIATTPEIQELLGEVQHSLKRIQDNVKQGGEIVQGLLKYSRKGDSGFSPVDFDQLINSSVEMTQFKIKADQLTIIKDYDEGALPKINGNFVQLQEVFFNLIDNAYDAAMQRKTEKNEPGFKATIRITAVQKDNSLRIGVVDNGIGVKDEDQNKLFTPFFTTKLSSKKGTGLGLYVIQKIIEENHKGKVSMSSEYMTGTLITVVLPII